MLVAGIIPMLVGFVYYHKKVAGNAWMSVTGMTEERQREGNMPMIFGISLIFAVLAAMFLSGFVWHEGQPEFQTFKHGAFHGGIASMFVVLPALGTNALYDQ